MSGSFDTLVQSFRHPHAERRPPDRWARHWLWIALLAVAFAGCGGGDDKDDDPAVLSIAASIDNTSDAQVEGVVGERLSSPITGRALTSTGEPADQARLVAIVYDPGGNALGSEEISTSFDGTFSHQPVLGTSVGIYRVEFAPAAEPQMALAHFDVTAHAGPVAQIAIRSGDDQTTTQYRRVPTQIMLRQYDRYGNERVDDLTVTPPAGTGYVGPTALTFPWVLSRWRVHFAAVGDHALRISHANGTSVDLMVHVLPTAYPLDGKYQCTLTRTSDSFVDARPQFFIEGNSLLNLELGPLESNRWPLYSSTLDLSTGTVFLIVRASLDNRYQMQGAIAADSSSGSGTYHETFATPAPSGPPSGSWTCSRS